MQSAPRRHEHHQPVKSTRARQPRRGTRTRDRAAAIGGRKRGRPVTAAAGADGGAASRAGSPAALALTFVLQSPHLNVPLPQPDAVPLAVAVQEGAAAADHGAAVMDAAVGDQPRRPAPHVTARMQLNKNSRMFTIKLGLNPLLIKSECANVNLGTVAKYAETMSLRITDAVRRCTLIANEASCLLQLFVLSRLSADAPLPLITQTLVQQAQQLVSSVGGNAGRPATINQDLVSVYETDYRPLRPRVRDNNTGEDTEAEAPLVSRTGLTRCLEQLACEYLTNIRTVIMERFNLWLDRYWFIRVEEKLLESHDGVTDYELTPRHIWSLVHQLRAAITRPSSAVHYPDDDAVDVSSFTSLHVELYEVLEIEMKDQGLILPLSASTHCHTALKFEYNAALYLQENETDIRTRWQEHEMQRQAALFQHKMFTAFPLLPVRSFEPVHITLNTTTCLANCFTTFSSGRSYHRHNGSGCLDTSNACTTAVSRMMPVSPS